MTEQKALAAAMEFDLPGEPQIAECYGNGHINDTFLVTLSGRSKSVILQKINTYVFTNPTAVMDNITLISEFLSEKITALGGDPERESLRLHKSRSGKTYFTDSEGGFWRCVAHIENTVGYEIISDSAQMYTSGKAFGNFQKMLSDFPAEKLAETIPNFHNTPVRFQAFLSALNENKQNRIKNAEKEIHLVLESEKEARIIQELLDSGKMPLRVTHNDTKLNNVLIDKITGQAVCVIDLDTVMPGAAIYDFGDSIRSGTNMGAEDEPDLSKVYMNMDFYEKFTEGYLSEAKEFLTPIEAEYLAFSAKLLSYELGMRFLTDYLNGDLYFKVSRENHNLDRARTQFKLFMEMEKNMDTMNKIVRRCL